MAHVLHHILMGRQPYNSSHLERIGARATSSRGNSEVVADGWQAHEEVDGRGRDGVPQHGRPHLCAPAPTPDLHCNQRCPQDPVLKIRMHAGR